jgi:UDP-N-acetylmuramoylalanine--D-glutamate ligase
MDTRADPPGLQQLQSELPGVAVFLQGLRADVLTRADLIVISPGIPLATPEIQAAQAQGRPVIGDIELFAQEAKAPVAAITGSNGKSTVTTLLGLMARDAGLRVGVGGNLGTPALDLLDPEVQLYVLELSSFQLESTYSLAPQVATVLNISPDHMDRYASLSDYVAAKARIFHGAAGAVLNRDDPLVMELEHPRQSRFFTLAAPGDAQSYGLVSIDGVDWVHHGEQPLLPVEQLRVAGWHNVANTLAALAMGELLGLPLPVMLDSIRAFPGLSHRTQYVATIQGVDFYNDSKGTNPGACIAALEGFRRSRDGGTVLIAGGDGKQADFADLGRAIRRSAIGLVLIGRDAERIAAAVGDGVPMIRATDMDAAVRSALQLTQAGDRVLLSPACASFDMFPDYRARGEAFVRAVRELES